ncbi:hypothetical protein XA68_10937 [Ophiocordyceps unilateralis]|uniref:Reverse transcriptase zinc-binding domain-containing protein n=1 Tax=Ophiocordyceps unilateralis TaxID=268505 RepID=A0A2A9P243_OPHUN|nr:hypothetical protein XA68_10937 [Ophiocordyceps unilateralis]
MSAAWMERWERLTREARTRRPRRDPVPADMLSPVNATKAALRPHEGLYKHESAALIQLRTGKIGLNEFLFQRGVPEVPSPLCRCGEGRETVSHIFLSCPLIRIASEQLTPRPRTVLDLAISLGHRMRAGAFVRWFLTHRPIPHFVLATSLAREWLNGDPDTTRSRPAHPTCE